MSEQLSAEEREALLQVLWPQSEGPDMGTRVIAATEAILASRLASRDARLAEVEALHHPSSLIVGDCHHCKRHWPCPTIRALHPDPSEAGA